MRLNQLSMHHALDVDPLEGSVGREQVAVVHPGSRRDQEVRLRDQRHGPELRQARADLKVMVRL